MALGRESDSREPVAISDVLGQPGATGTITRALATGRVHHAYRFEGPDGVGKEKLAFELAKALVCVAPAAGGLACDACDACRRATTFGEEPRVPKHADVILVARNLYPPAALGRTREETQDISVDQVRRVILSRLAFPPHEGRGRVVIVRGAEDLGASAANALLKTLEEPPARTYFVLITPRPEELLDTVRSRTQAVRFGPLGDQVLGAILEARGVEPVVRARVVPAAGGSAAVALSLTEDDGSLSEHERFAEAALRAVGEGDVRAMSALAGGKEAKREDLRARLVALARGVAEAAVAASGHDQRRWATRHRLVLATLSTLERNPAAALAVEGLLLRMMRTS